MALLLLKCWLVDHPGAVMNSIRYKTGELAYKIIIIVSIIV